MVQYVKVTILKKSDEKRERRVRECGGSALVVVWQSGWAPRGYGVGRVPDQFAHLSSHHFSCKSMGKTSHSSGW